ncbi:MAG TPA: phosphotransferase family protein [Longimicrobiaceae bacterium]|nr:phosphotransferase family protein [Longimicrobiaceae bacterium]
MPERLEPGTIPVRDGEQMDWSKAVAWLRERRSVVPQGPVNVSQFPSGASNLTYLLRVGEWEGVLRRAPLGPVAPKAHDMVREAGLLRRLHPHFPLAPRLLALCDDPAVIGAPFHVMEYRRGIVIDAKLPPGAEPTEALGRRISEGVIDTLVRLHAVDYEAAGLDEFGHPEGFLKRQLEGWSGRYRRAATGEIPEVEPLLASLAERLPASPPATVVHNDFKLNNLLLDPSDLGRVVGVLDWEMATVGDPLFDLGVSLGYWIQADDPPQLQGLLPSVTTLPGFYTRDELMARYAERSGRDLTTMDWYLRFAYFKLAVILQQIYARWVKGQTKDPRFGNFGQAVRLLIGHAHGLSARGIRTAP